MEPESPTSSECDVLVKSFFQLQHNEQVTQFSHFDLNRQFVTYICGMRSIHPSTLYLVDAFAKEGRAAFPFLAKKLIETKTDASFRDILQIFGEMQRTKTYDAAAEKDLMIFMERRASEVQDKFWREYTEKLISDILRP
jgi:hypothetical protein